MIKDRNSGNRILSFGVVMAALVCGASHAADAPEITGESSHLTREDALSLVRAYLFQSFVERNGQEYTAAFYGHSRNNHLETFGLETHAFAFPVREIVTEDEESSYPEYRVRGMMAQGISVASNRTTQSESQELLWSLFLDDPRYVARILTKLSNLDGADFDAQEEIPLEVTNEELEDVATRLAASLAERASYSGCDAQAITSVFALWDADPMLVSAVLANFALLPPEERSVEAARADVISRGWIVPKESR